MSEKNHGLGSFIFRSRLSFFEMSEWPSLLYNVALGSSSVHPSRKPGVHLHQMRWSLGGESLLECWSDFYDFLKCVCVCVHCGRLIGDCGTASLSFLSLSFSSLPDKALQLIETL